MTEVVSMLPREIALQVSRGTDNGWTFQLTTADGTPVDITADDVKFTILDKIGGTVKYTDTNTAGNHYVPAEGKTRFYLPRSAIDDEVNNIRTVKWWYDIRRLKATDEENVYIEGPMEIHPAGSSP